VQALKKGLVKTSEWLVDNQDASEIGYRKKYAEIVLLSREALQFCCQEKHSRSCENEAEDVRD